MNLLAPGRPLRSGGPDMSGRYVANRTQSPLGANRVPSGAVHIRASCWAIPRIGVIMSL